MNIKGILKGTVITYFLVAFFVLIAAALTYFNLLDENKISILIYIGTAVSIFAGSFLAAKTSESRILLNSLAISVIFVMILLTASFIVNNEINTGARTIAIASGAVAAGFLGAVIGK